MVTKEKLEQEVQVHQVEPDSNSFNRLALSEVRKTKEHKESWSLKRKSGARNIGTGVQRFCNAFSSYLSAYTGIVEVVKGIDNQYGGLAYGTLSVLLSVSLCSTIHSSRSCLALALPNPFPISINRSRTRGALTA